MLNTDPDTKLWGSEELINFANSIDGVDDDFKKFLKNADASGDLMEQYQLHLQKSTKATSLFSNSLKSLVASLGVTLAISVALSAAAKIFDYLNVTLEEQQNTVNNLTEKITTLKSEYDELSSKGALSDVDEQRLDYLQRQISLNEAILKQENEKLALSKMYGKGDLFSTGELKAVGLSDDEDNKIQNRMKQLDKYRETYQDVVNRIGENENPMDDQAGQWAAKQEAKITEALAKDKEHLMQLQKDAMDSYDIIKEQLDNGYLDNNPAEKERAENLLTYYKGKADEFAEYIASIDIKLNIDTDDIKTKLANAFQQNSKYRQDQGFTPWTDSQVEWLDTLSDDELNYLYSIKNVGDLSFDDVQEKIKELREETSEEINVEIDTSAKSVLTDLEAMSDGFEKIGAIYEDVKNKGDFDFGSLVSDEDFINIFGDYTDEYNKFVEVVSNSPSDIQACQGAFDDLVSTWFYAQDPLKNITDETYNLSVKWLEQAGVANANEVATYALAQSKAQAWLVTHDLINATDEEINKFLQENSAIGITKEMLYSLQMSMIAVNQQGLDFSQQIAALNSLASAAGLAGISMSAVNTAARYYSYGGMNQEQAQQQALDDAIAMYQKKLQSASIAVTPNINYGGSSKSPSGSGGGSSSKKEKYVAEIDKYKELSDAVEDVESKISDLDLLLDHTDSLEGQIALNDKLIGLYKEEQDALTALNNARDKEISDNVAKLRAKGFQIDYDPKTDNLQIKNREHLNELSQDIIKDYEELIKRTDELNDANKESANTWTELTYKIADVGKEITKLRIDQYDKYISDAEHLIELLSNRKDALGKDLPIYDKMMQQTVATWKQLVEDGYDKNREKIQELESAWMKYYDARLEREKELLKKQLDDHDSALDAILNLIDAQNEKLDDQISSLKKVNEERKEALDLQKAQADLDKARNQKVRKVLRKDQGFIYEANQDAIKEAAETLSDKKYEAHISVLEKQKEALDEIKNKWAEIPDLFDKYQDELLASQILGANWEEKILDDREDAYEDFRDAYFDLQDDIKDKSDELENHLNESYLEMVRIFEKYGQLNASPTLSANVSTGKTWYVERDGSSPKDAQIGDIVKTRGGTYQIVAPNTPGAGYNAKTGRWNLKLDDNSADIKDGMWGTIAGTNGVTKTTTGDITKLAVDPSKNGNKQLTSAIGNNTLSNQGIVDAANDQIDATYEGITGLEAASRYLANNSVFTQEETNVLMKHMGLVDKNSESEDANTDASDANTAGLNDNTSSQAQNTAATDDLTRAITDLSFAQMQADQYVAQNNMKAGVSNEKWLDYWDHVLELTEDPLWKGKFTQADINNALAQRNQYAQLVRQEQAVKDLMNGKEPTKVELSDKDKEIIKSLQASWNAAKEAGNEQGMELAHQLAEAVRNGYDISPTLATKSDYKLSDTTFTGGGSAGSGSKSKIQADREWQLEKAKEFGASKDYINRLETAIAIEKYGSGSKVETYTDEQGRTSTIISSVNKAEENMSDADLQKRWDSGWRPTMNSIDKLDSGLKNTNDGLSDNSDANYYAGDSALESAEIVKESAETMADSVQSAYRDMVSAINSAVSSNGYGSGSGSGSGGGGRGGSSDGESAELKQYKFAYEVAKSQGNKEAAKTIQGHIDRLSSSGSSNSSTTTLNGKKVTKTVTTNGNKTTTTYKDSSGKTVASYSTTSKKKKAKGGINLPEDFYVVDEHKKQELLINPAPDNGRYVRIEKGGGVIPADVTKRLWKFGMNPVAFFQEELKGLQNYIAYMKPNTSSIVNHYHIESVQLPNVTDVPSFLKELQSLPNKATQWSTRR